ncbi:MAG: DUF4231 domain-containing protein [Leptolyngbyaceae cyanobacterium MO_188.B28]|nr:DUF4231 domain-containing protein [Leptolyngbyaceae cyanobacterium MO_188.B28]
MAKFDYSAYLQESFSQNIDSLDLSDQRKRFLKDRWLDQLLYQERKAGKEQTRFVRSMVFRTIGGAIATMLMGVSNVSGDLIIKTFGWTAFVLNGSVNIVGGVSDFMKFGDKHVKARVAAERLKSSGWQYFQLCGVYKQFVDHSDAYKAFARETELLIQQDLEGFIAQAEDKSEKGEEKVVIASASIPPTQDNLKAIRAIPHPQEIASSTKNTPSEQTDSQPEKQSHYGEDGEQAN